MNVRKSIEIFFFCVVSLISFLPLLTFGSYFGDFDGPKVMFFEGVVAILLPFFVYLVTARDNSVIRWKNSGFVWFILYLFWMVISAWFGFDFQKSFFGSFFEVGGILLFICLLLYVLYISYAISFSEIIFYRLAKLQIGVALCVSVYAILEFFHLVPVLNNYLPRASSTLGNPSHLGSYLVWPAVFSAWFFVKQMQSRKKGFYGLVFLIIACGMLVSETRALIVAGVIGCLYLCFVLLKFTGIKKKKYITWILGLLVGICVILFGSVFFQGKNRLIDFSDTNVTNRFTYWQIALQSVKDHPVFGTGPGNYQYVFQKHVHYGSTTEAMNTTRPHNQFLEILSTTGIIGCFIWVMFIYVLFQTLRTKITLNQLSQNERLVFETGLIVYFVQSMFMFDTISVMVGFGLFIAYIFAPIQRQSVPNEQKRCVSLFVRVLSIIGAVSFSVVLLVYVVVPYLVTMRLMLLVTESPSPSDVLEYFDQVERLPFLLDPTYIGARYGSKASWFVGRTGSTDLSVHELFVRSEQKLKQGLDRVHGQNGRWWYYLAKDYLDDAMYTHTEPNSEWRNAIQKSIELMPEVADPQLAYLYEEAKGDRLDFALEQAMELNKRDPNNPQVLWLISQVYGRKNQEDLAISYGYNAIEKGIGLPATDVLIPFLEYYTKKRDYRRLIVLFLKASDLEPSNVTWKTKLAVAYKQNGELDKAVLVAEEIKKQFPGQKQAADTFLQSIRDKNK